jgi:sulfide dehydrogenase cytochrome subunit
MQKPRVLMLCAAMAVAPMAWSADNIAGLARTCYSCHGTDGVSAGKSMPSLAGLPEQYLKNVMMQWKSGERSSANMTRLISGYSDEEIAGLAAYFAKMKWTPVPQPASAALLAKGKEVVSDKCESCHGATGSESDEDTPKLYGQWAKYMELELEKYRDDGFTMPHKKMTKVARKLSEDEVAAVAAYFAAQSK